MEAETRGWEDTSEKGKGETRKLTEKNGVYWNALTG